LDHSKKVSATDCHHCVGRALSPFCGALSADEMNTFMKLKRGHHYSAGQTIFYEGNPCQGIYILCSGSVKLTQSSQTGQQQIIGIVSPGDLIEKGALFHAGAHSSTAEAMARVEVSFFDRQEFLDLLKLHPHLSIRLITVLSQEAEKGWERSRSLLFKSAMERLIDILLELARRHGEKKKGATMIGLELKREELAEMVGVTLETAIRMVALLKKEKLIRVEGRKILILNEEQLADRKRGPSGR
jgi:CRP/FNR family transcriptional regulator